MLATPIMIDAHNCAPSTSEWPTSWVPDLNITQAWLTDLVICRTNAQL